MTQIEYGTNAQQAWRREIQGYEGIDNPLFVVLRELIQNSADAIRTRAQFTAWLRLRGVKATYESVAQHLDREPEFRTARAAPGFTVPGVDEILAVEPGRISVSFEWVADKYTLIFTDNGTGMARDIIIRPDGKAGPFLSLGDTGKTGNDAGGFGTAKAIIFTIGSEGWTVQTRDMVLRGSRPGAGGIAFESGPFVDGTVFRAIGVPRDSFQLRGFGDTNFHPAGMARLLLGSSDLTGIRVEVDGRPVTGIFASAKAWTRGKKKKGEGAPAKASNVVDSYDWGTGNTVVGRFFQRPDDGPDANPGAVYVRLNKLLQFTTAPSGGELEIDVVLDISTTTRPDQKGYPFNPQRNSLVGNARTALDSLLTKLVVDAGTGARGGGFDIISPDQGTEAERKAATRVAARQSEVLGSAAALRQMHDLYTAEAVAASEHQNGKRLIRELKQGASTDVEEAPERADITDEAGKAAAAATRAARAVDEAAQAASIQAQAAQVQAESKDAPSWSTRDKREAVINQIGEKLMDMLRTLESHVHKQSKDVLINLRSYAEQLRTEGSIYNATTYAQYYADELAGIKRNPTSPLSSTAFAQVLQAHLDLISSAFALSNSSTEEQANFKKSVLETNPFGSTARIDVSRTNFRDLEGKGGVESSRYREFRRDSMAGKYDPYLVLWDQAVTAVVSTYGALNKREGIGGVRQRANITRRLYKGRYIEETSEIQIADIEDVPWFSIGFVLDDAVLGHNSGGVICVNPLAFREIVEAHKARPYAIAQWVYSVACHEVTHLFDPRGHSLHDETFISIREDVSARCSYLLPLIETVLMKVFPARIVSRDTPPGCESAVHGAKAKATRAANKHWQAEADKWAAERTDLQSRIREGGDPHAVDRRLLKLARASAFYDFLSTTDGEQIARDLGINARHAQDLIFSDPNLRRRLINDL